MFAIFARKIESYVLLCFKCIKIMIFAEPSDFIAQSRGDVSLAQLHTMQIIHDTLSRIAVVSSS